MKTLGKVIAGLLVYLVLLLLVLHTTGLEPKGVRPGLWLKGNLVTTPVTDWSFADKKTIQVQTRTWYLLPHSVNMVSVTYDGHLYLGSVHYRPGVRYRWNDDLLRDPHVRIKVGNQLYDRTVTCVTDPAEKAGVMAKKYSANPKLLSSNLGSTFFRVED